MTKKKIRFQLAYNINHHFKHLCSTSTNVGLFDCLLDGVQQYYSYIVAVSFIGGGNPSTQRKPQTCRKWLTNFIT